MNKNIISKSLFAIICIAVTPSVLLAIDLPPQSVPDSGSSLILLTVSILGFFAFRQFKGK